MDNKELREQYGKMIDKIKRLKSIYDESNLSPARYLYLGKCERNLMDEFVDSITCLRNSGTTRNILDMSIIDVNENKHLNVG